MKRRQRRQGATAGWALLLGMAAGGPAQQPGTQGEAAQALRRAIATAEAGRPELARQQTEELLASYPDYEPALKFEGALLDQAGRPAEAQRFFERALKLAPEDPELLFSVGVGELRAKQYAEAAAVLARGTRLSPADSQMFFYLAQAEHLAGDEDSALAASRHSVELDPADAALEQKYGELLSTHGDHAEALAALRKAQSLDAALPRIDFDLGLASLRKLDLEAAAGYAAAADRRQPGDLKVLRLQAEIAVKLGQWTTAQGALMQVVALDEGDTTSRVELAHCQIALKQFDEAVRTLEDVLRHDPANVQAHFYLARAYTGLGRKADAAHENQMHAELAANAAAMPQQADAQAALMTQARALLTADKEAEAVALFRQHIDTVLPSPAEPALLTGVAYLSMGRGVDAERLFRQALALDAGVRDARGYLGILALQRGDLAGAEQQFLAELQLHPDSRVAVAGLGELRYQQGRWGEAVEHLTKAHSAAPVTLLMLADAYFRLGMKAKAVLSAELAADYGADDPAVLRRVQELLRRQGETVLAEELASRPRGDVAGREARE